jgi:hypothetical protein
MAIYRLRAAKRKPDGTPDAPRLDDLIDADTLDEAKAKAKHYPVDRFLDNTDYAWLTDSIGKTVWELKLEEA